MHGYYGYDDEDNSAMDIPTINYAEISAYRPDGKKGSDPSPSNGGADDGLVMNHRSDDPDDNSDMDPPTINWAASSAFKPRHN